ncbi:MAG: PhzF family phenazine biosynthesis protein [Solirubrobacteraceae bacterium]|nr:PhzF family phenazine biosynthesis protein [Solirubrobacteraceae bacterium]
MPGDAATIAVEVLRVFCDEYGDHGNPLGVVLDGASLPGRAARQELAYELGFSETVFVDGPAGAPADVAVQIFTPTAELPLAGHPLVGTAWLLAQEGEAPAALVPPAGRVECAASEHHAEIVANPAAAPVWHLAQRPAPDDVNGLDPADFGPEAHDYVWAWLDEHAGLVRARSFASGKGIREDEATGSAALVLCRELGRAIRIRQGRGSVIDATPEAGGLVRVRGRVVRDERVSIDG